MDSETHITHMTHTPDGGHATEGLGETFGVIYTELEHIARGLMRREHAGHTLGTAGVLHETYIRLIRTYAGQQEARSLTIESLRAICAKVMRHVLVDHARKRGARARANDAFSEQLDTSLEQLRPGVIDLLALNDALNELEGLDQRKARVVELRFFSGMPMGQVAEVLGVPLRTVERDWSFARAWLRTRIEGMADES